MENRLRLLPAILIVLLSCSSPTGNKDKGGDTPGGDILISGTIDSGGGTLTADDIVISIPAGALQAETTVTISEDTVPSENADVVTGAYTLTGIPSDIDGEIEVRLKYSGALTQTSFIVTSQPMMNAENDSLIMACDVIEAVDDGGFLKAVIPVSSLRDVPKAVALNADFEMINLSVFGITNHVRITKGSRFLLVFPYENLFFAQGVGDALDEAYDLGVSWGLQYSFPGESSAAIDSVVVGTVIRMFNDDFKGNPRPIQPLLFSDTGKHSPQIGYLKSAVSPIFDSNNRLDAMSSFFEMVLMHYKAVRWHNDFFPYAILGWLRKEVSTVQPYSPPGFTKAPLTVLGGIQAIQYRDLDDTGDALSAYVEYLDKKYDLLTGNGLASLLTNIHGGDSYAEALEKLTGAGENIWWPDFVKEFLTGELDPVYDVSATTVIADKNIAGSFTATEADSIETFAEEYHGLQSRLYRIQVSDSVEETLDYLRFSVGSSDIASDYISVMVFGLKDGKLRYIDRSADFGVGEIDEYTDNNTFYALVMNNAIMEYFWDSRAIEFTVEAVKKETPLIGDLNTLSFSVSVFGEYLYKKTNFPDEIKEYDLPDTVDWIVTGALDGTRFTGNASTTEGDVTHSMSAWVDFDETFQNITYFSFSGSHEDTSGDKWRISMSATGGDIPYSSTYVGWRIYKLQGTGVCNAVRTMNYYSTSERTVLGTTIYSSTEMQSFTCSDDSFIRIELKEQ